MIMKKLIIILLAAVMVLLCACGDSGNTSTPAESTPAENSTPADISAPEVSSPAENSAAEESDVFVPDTEVSEESEEPEDSYANCHVDESGVFASDYECGVDIEVRWVMQTQPDDKVLLTAEIYLYSYSVKVSARYNNCVLSVNGKETVFSTPNINVEDCKEKEYTYLATVQTEVTVDEEHNDFDIRVSFPFRGTYNDVALPSLEAAENFSVMPDGTVVY
jgi:hypothetical protein